jgi:hypothetical protein
VGSFSQWRRSADSGEIRRVTYVCGAERVLVEEVVDSIRTGLDVSALDRVTFTAGTDPDRDIWAAAHQYPLTPGARRLVCVRAAEKIRYWQPLPGWLAATRQLPGVYLLFVSGDDSPAPGVPVEAVKAPRGHLVRCAAPNEADAVAWVRRRAPALDDTTAGYLLTRTGGDLAAAATACTKISLFDGVPGTQVVDQLCAQVPAASFVESLLTLRKPDALRAAAVMAPEEYGRALATLDQRLDAMAVLWRAVRAGHTAREVASVPTFLVRQLAPHAKHYDPARCAYRRKALAVVEDAHRGGARTGVLEALVALW